MDDICFFIAPIGADGSEIRRRSDGVRDFVVAPAAAELGLRTVRADHVARPGQITLNVIEHVLGAKAAVADLTDANPNVYYELAVRHTMQLPVVLIADDEQIAKLPFDIQQMRVVGFDHTDLASAARAKELIASHLRAAMDGAVDSPISTVVNLQKLAHGNTAEQALAELATRIDGLSGLVRELHSGASGSASPVGQEPELVRALLLSRLAIESDRRGYVLSTEVNAEGEARLVLSVPVPGQDPLGLTIAFERLTEERVRNLLRAAQRAQRAASEGTEGLPEEGWTQELKMFPEGEPEVG